jgi:hypothetical protein
MKRNAFLMVLLVLSFTRGSSQLLVGFDKLEMSDNAFYMVSRGTDSKSGIIAGVFNTVEYCSTHVGIGLIENGMLQVYHVENNRDGQQTGVVCESIQSFSSCKGAIYLSVWKYDLSIQEIQLLRRVLMAYTQKNITFDYDFNPNDNEKMYCSEFCVKVLKAINAVAFNYPLTTVSLDSLYSFALGRDILNYWPVDFFELDHRFNKIYESYAADSK